MFVSVSNTHFQDDSDEDFDNRSGPFEFTVGAFPATLNVSATIVSTLAPPPPSLLKLLLPIPPSLLPHCCKYAANSTTASPSSLHPTPLPLMPKVHPLILSPTPPFLLPPETILSHSYYHHSPHCQMYAPQSCSLRSHNVHSYWCVQYHCQSSYLSSLYFYLPHQVKRSLYPQ